tara:strand:- start:231 stop:662 length:432 start_codon:yes stop_codon:yes gene_type:complete
MNDTKEILTLEPSPEPSPLPEPPCTGTFNPFDCMMADQFDTEHRFLAVVILALACAVLSLCVLVCILTLLVHKISAVWMKAVLGKAVEKSDPNDARKGLLGDTIKSSFSSSSSKSKAEGKKKKTSFAEDTSCAPPRDVDEEDL